MRTGLFQSANSLEAEKTVKKLHTKVRVWWRDYLP